MTAIPAFAPAPASAPVPRLFDDLDRSGALFLRHVRLWSWGAVNRQNLALAAPLQYGPARANCLLAALDELCALLNGPRGHGPNILPPDSEELSDDEAGLVAVFLLAADDPEAVVAHLAAGLGPTRAHSATIAVHAIAQVICTPRAAPATGGAAPCVTGCPARAACPERADLKPVP